MPERAETDSFNIVAQKSVRRYGTSSDETASDLPVSWGEITKAEATEVEAEVEVNQVVGKILTRSQRK